MAKVLYADNDFCGLEMKLFLITLKTEAVKGKK